MDRKLVYKTLLEDGMILEKNRITVSQYQRLGKSFYQVHSDNYKAKESLLFKADQLDEAVDKFIELLKKVS